jgi:cytochrome oxidase Cu insertion factor (SCO1/SenC/PrrC family)
MTLSRVGPALLASAVLVLEGAAPAARRSLQDPPEVTTLGPQVGEKAPDFSLPDQEGQRRSLASLLGPNGLVLVFFRSADW